MTARRCWLLATLVLLSRGAYAGDHRADGSIGMTQSAGGKKPGDTKQGVAETGGQAEPNHVGGQASFLWTLGYHPASAKDSPHSGDHPWSGDVNVSFDRSLNRASVTLGMRYTRGIGTRDETDHAAHFVFLRLMPLGRRFASGDRSRAAYTAAIGLDSFPWKQRTWGIRTQLDYVHTIGSEIDHPLRLGVGVVWRKHD